jgi:hypothetical protein
VNGERQIPRMHDFTAQWPSRYWGGPVLLDYAGRYATPQGAGTCEIGQRVAIDPDYPLIAQWTGTSWRYRRRVTEGTILKVEHATADR